MYKQPDENSVMSWLKKFYYYNYTHTKILASQLPKSLIVVNCKNRIFFAKTSLNFHLVFYIYIHIYIYIYIYIVHIYIYTSLVEEIQIGFQDVEFLHSRDSFYTFLKNCDRGKVLGTATCLETMAVGNQGHAPCKIYLLQ